MQSDLKKRCVARSGVCAWLVCVSGEPCASLSSVCFVTSMSWVDLRHAGVHPAVKNVWLFVGTVDPPLQSIESVM